LKLSIYLLPTTFIKVVGNKYILSSYAQHGMKGIKIVEAGFEEVLNSYKETL
jgi:hypothetical protein